MTSYDIRHIRSCEHCKHLYEKQPSGWQILGSLVLAVLLALVVLVAAEAWRWTRVTEDRIEQLQHDNTKDSGDDDGTH